MEVQLFPFMILAPLLIKNAVSLFPLLKKLGDTSLWIYAK